MSVNSAARAARFIFRPSAASAGGVCVRSHRIPNAAAAYRRHMSELVPTRRAFLVDTLALVRRMEAQGIESKHADAIAMAITEAIPKAINVVLNDSLKYVAESFVSKGEMQKSMMIQDANISKFKSEVQSMISKFKSEVQSMMIHDANLSKFKSEVQSSQDYHYSLLQRATEKRRGDTDLPYGWIHHELAKQIAETSEQIAETRDRIIKQIAESRAEANDRITRQIAEARDRISEANDRITKQIAEARDRISEANDRITKLNAKNNEIKLC